MVLIISLSAYSHPNLCLAPPPGFCEADIERFCRGVEPGEGRLEDCLTEQLEEEEEGNAMGAWVATVLGWKLSGLPWVLWKAALLMCAVPLLATPSLPCVTMEAEQGFKWQPSASPACRPHGVGGVPARAAGIQARPGHLHQQGPAAGQGGRGGEGGWVLPSAAAQWWWGSLVGAGAVAFWRACWGAPAAAAAEPPAHAPALPSKLTPYELTVPAALEQACREDIKKLCYKGGNKILACSNPEGLLDLLRRQKRNVRGLGVQCGGRWGREQKRGVYVP